MSVLAVADLSVTGSCSSVRVSWASEPVGTQACSDTGMSVGEFFLLYP